MRKIIVLSFITLDGVMQAPGAPEEDTSNGFKYGGWVAPYNDEEADEVMKKQLEPADLLLGRRTFDIFASYWPQHAAHWPGINEVTKYVLSNTMKQSGWSNCVFLTSVDDIKKLKDAGGSDLKIWGSSELVQLLMQHDLVDEFWLNIHPIILGKGKRLFSDTSIPAAFTMAERKITTSGVIIVNYKKSGEVRTGTVGQ